MNKAAQKKMAETANEEVNEDGVPDFVTSLNWWVNAGAVRPLDAALCQFFAEKVRRDTAPADARPYAAVAFLPWPVALAVVLLSHQFGRGHVCLDLNLLLEKPQIALAWPNNGQWLPALGRTDAPPTHEEWLAHSPAAFLRHLTLPRWQDELRALPMLIGELSAGELADPAAMDRATPLLLCAQRLYLLRCWREERLVENTLRDFSRRELGYDPATLQKPLSILFPPAGQVAAAHGERIDWQKLACALALRRALTVITGGPGTGKTTTVVKLLLLAQLAAQAATKEGVVPLRIRLAAPTGKAASRLSQSIASSLQSLRERDDVRAIVPEALWNDLPQDVVTVHRLLQVSAYGPAPFRHHRHHRLPLDLLVVDEASMIDLHLMASLMSALPDNAQLVLLGDKDQLASVEAGAVLASLCTRADEVLFSQPTITWLTAALGDLPLSAVAAEETTELAQSVVKLRHSYRFHEDSTIGCLARAVNEGRAEEAEKLLHANTHAELHYLSPQALQDQALSALVVGSDEVSATGCAVGYGHYLRVLQQTRPAGGASAADYDVWARGVLQAHSQFQLLTALREGDWGIEGLNRRTEQILAARKLIAPVNEWYEGRPVLVTRNDRDLGLANGDIGMVLRVPRAIFSSAAVPVPVPVPVHLAPALHQQVDATDILRVAFMRYEEGENGGKEIIRWFVPARLNQVETVYALTVHKSQGSEFAHTALILAEESGALLSRELLYTAITRARQALTVGEVAAGVLSKAVNQRLHRASGLFAD